jgi:hypothetical protein
MKSFFILTLFITINLFSCEGDCVKCHPILLKNNGKMDNNHLILKKCKDCHNLTTNDMQKMNAGCGEDCWNCHSIKEVKKINIPEHTILDNCIKCHIKLKEKNNLNFNSFNDTSIYNELLNYKN